MAIFLQLLPVILGPLVTAGIKKLTPKIPKVVLPMVCAVIGAVSDVGVTEFQNMTQDPTYSVLIGMAGSAVRETADQLRKVVKA